MTFLPEPVKSPFARLGGSTVFCASAWTNVRAERYPQTELIVILFGDSVGAPTARGDYHAGKSRMV